MRHKKGNNGSSVFFSRLFKEKPLGAIGFVFVIAFILVAIFADVLAPYGVNESHGSTEFISPPSSRFLLGTDNIGRDMLTRIIFAIRISVGIGVTGALISTIISVLIGTICAYIGGKFDMIFQRFVDIVMSFPTMVILMALLSITGQSIATIILVMGVLWGITGSRIIRGTAMNVKNEMYIKAAVCIGCKPSRIILRHMLKNIAASIIVLFTSRVPLMIITEASLSFLGFGISPPTPSLGGMLSGTGRTYMYTSPWLAFWPGLMLSMIIFSVNIFGDAVRDLLDPKLRGGTAHYGVKPKIKKIEGLPEVNSDGEVISVENLHTRFKTGRGVVKAVNGLSYSVKRGECIGIVGESGCGKSVGALSVCRLITTPPGEIYDGRIIMQNKDILQLPEAMMRELRGNKISLVFQEPMSSLNPVLPVGDQISEVLKVHYKSMSKKDRIQKTIEIMKAVGIPQPEERINDYPHQFSGGMQQRVMIAMALICEPDLLIADEPTTSLDVTVQAQILETMAKLREEFGTATVIITHNLGIVARYVERVFVMYAGSVVEHGDTVSVYANPGHPYTKGLLQCVPRLDKKWGGSLTTIPGQPPKLFDLSEGCAFAERCTYCSDKCKKEKPELRKIGDNHYAACFYDINLVEN